MQWNIAAECISIVIVCIIAMYARKGSGLPTLKNKLFQGCLFITFLAMVSNVASTEMIGNAAVVPLWLTRFVTGIYFLLTPLMGLFYFYYSAVIVFEVDRGIPKRLWLNAIAGAVYAILVLTNPLTGFLFTISDGGEYRQGSLIPVTYIVFYLYCIGSLILVLIKGKNLERQIHRILTVFPIIALLVIVFQQFYPQVVLSGSAATCALLIIYLHLQNRQISIDYLTNIPNRRELSNMISLLIRRPDKPPFVVITVSLREFSQVNAAYGQKNGDTVLQEVAKFLATISASYGLYRFNGDEFAILVRNPGSDKVAAIIRRIRERMEQTWDVGELSGKISVAIGVISYPESAESLEELINGLQFAVAKAKQENGFCYCGKETLDEIRRRQQIVDILKDITRNGGFEMYYQPIIDVKTGRFLYAESLMRINESPLGPIYPSEFIPVAEETGLIVEITYQILDRVCKFINRLMAEGIKIGRIHVNFSGIQFNRSDLLEKTDRIIQNNRVPYSKIKIEFTESTMAENAETVTKFTSMIHEKGVHVGLDDFGTGYSNLHSVLDIPFDTVKLDKSLVWCSMGCSRTTLLVRNITAAFHDLGINVVAEGVETEEQAAFVKDCGIDQIQGYLYARPMPEDDAVAFLKLEQEKFEEEEACAKNA